MRKLIYVLIAGLLASCGDLNVNGTGTINVTQPQPSSGGTSGGGGSSGGASPSSGGTSAPAETPVASATPTPDPSPTPTPTPTPIALTYYKMSALMMTNTSTGATITGVGYCVVYSGDGDTYCWDDGIKDLAGTPWSMSFWDVDNSNQSCSTTCTSDRMTEPTRITANLQAVLDYNNHNLFTVHRTPSIVLTSGTPVQVSCSLNGHLLECGDFTIDLSQADI